jgi:hypothetical protein
LETFIRIYPLHGITDVAFPHIGCGHGELDWDSEVKPVFEYFLKKLPIDVFVYYSESRTGIPEHKGIAVTQRWLRSQPRSLAFSEFWDDLKDIISMQDYYRIKGTDEMFSAELDNESITIISNERTRFEKEEMLALWQEIRLHGYLYVDRFPPVFSGAERYLLSLLSEFEYLEPKELFKETGGERHDYTGLELRVPSSEQADMFAEVTLIG